MQSIQIGCLKLLYFMIYYDGKPLCLKLLYFMIYYDGKPLWLWAKLQKQFSSW